MSLGSYNVTSHRLVTSKICMICLQSAWILVVLVPRRSHLLQNIKTGAPHQINQGPRELLQAEPFESCGRRPGFEKFLASGKKLKEPSRYIYDDWWERFERVMPHATTSRHRDAAERSGSKANQKECEKRKSIEGARRPPKNSHITYGERALWGEFPSYAAIVVKAMINDEEILVAKCGATIIGPRTLLTAGHCIGNMEESLESISVMVGWNSPNRRDRKLHKLEKACRANDYYSKPFVTKNGTYSFVWHDFMILYTKEAIQYNDFVHPACIPIEADVDMQPNNETKYLGVGMGYVEPTKTILPTHLRFTEFSLPCRDSQLSPIIEHDITQRCIRGIFGTKTCRGDSGGPLYYEPDPYAPRQNRRQFVDGIISSSPNHCRIDRDRYDKMNYYLNYVDVASIRDLLNDTMAVCGKPE